MFRIMIVEDDDIIGNILAEHLKKWGYDAYRAVKYDDIVTEFNEINPELVVMDINLPVFNGYHWCSEIRKTSQVPIIFASSESDNMNLIMAINMGADDFICKPFDLNVMVAKIQALLRRTYSFKEQKTNVLQCGEVVLNQDDLTLSHIDKVIELSKNEYKIVQILMQNKDKVVSRDEIITALWEDENFIDDNALTVNIARIRKKLESDLGVEKFIKTIKGVGYIIND